MGRLGSYTEHTNAWTRHGQLWGAAGPTEFHPKLVPKKRFLRPSLYIVSIIFSDNNPTPCLPTNTNQPRSTHPTAPFPPSPPPSPPVAPTTTPPSNPHRSVQTNNGSEGRSRPRHRKARRHRKAKHAAATKARHELFFVELTHVFFELSSLVVPFLAFRGATARPFVFAGRRRAPTVGHARAYLCCAWDRMGRCRRAVVRPGV